MIIISKFAGVCKKCNVRIPQGVAIEWTREAGASHVSADDCSKAQAAVASQPVVETPKLDATSIVEFISRGKASGLKYPKMRFLAPDGKTEMQISLATKHDGVVYIKLAGSYLGSVRADGSVTGELSRRDDVQATIKAIAADPAAAAKAYSVAYVGRCSFCTQKLTDEGSTEAGYGPICAKNYGLPHKSKGTPVLQPIAA